MQRSNQTNLALKGIIGIEAMAAISSVTDNVEDATNRTEVSYDYIDHWQTLAIAHDANPPHTTLSYGDNQSHGQFTVLVLLKESMLIGFRSSVQSVR